ncbi:hypothetical protein JCM3765_000090 [Sporobolomyces pararoseus]
MLKLLFALFALTPLLGAANLQSSFNDLSTLGRKNPLAPRHLEASHLPHEQRKSSVPDKITLVLLLFQTFLNGRGSCSSLTSTSADLLLRRSPQNNNNNGGGGGGAKGGNNNNKNDGFDPDPQKSLCLVANQVSTGAQQDGQDNPEPNQVASATSVNNFINFCLTRSDLPLTNGNQVKTGSCNGIVMGVIAAQAKMPSAKFVNPANLDTIPPNKDFTIQMKINNLVTGNFVNAQKNYFSAPQNTDDSGTIIGHSHVVIEEIGSLTSTDVTNPQVFAFFKGLNAPASNGVLSTDVTGGLPAGVYKMSSINTAANHQPALVGVAQHGSLDDAVYFTVSDNNNNNNNNGGGGNNNKGGSSTQVSSSSSSSSTDSSSSSFQSSSSFVSSSSSSSSGGFKSKRHRDRRHPRSNISIERSEVLFPPSLLEKRLQNLLEKEVHDA